MNSCDRIARPAWFCAALMAALDAADGRSRKRKRDQTPDVIGLRVKRELLEQVVRDDPDPQAFEGWLLQYVSACESIPGTTLAMARSVFDEWRLAQEMRAFVVWLAEGAPSADCDERRPAERGRT